MSTRTFNGKKYTLEDAFPTKGGATKAARDYRAAGDMARVVDGGKNAGRLRYMVYTR